ncbi:MAG: replication-associated recombination protein A [Gemmatimonadota bacterium]|nr:MAG: replication-associated recombination protein A [Gemmatimonadota bacterium]
MSEELDLFPSSAGVPAPRGIADERSPAAPLATRMRPRSLDEFLGQEHLVGPGRVLREMIERDELQSLIFWGPPGSGKTTLARIIAERTDAAFVPFSAVTEGVARVRQVIAEAEERLRATGRRTILFCDEIHRFNRAQQDAFLPHVEAGTIILIGATTENPSFEVNSALLSRSRVLVLEALSEPDLRTICERALSDRERGLGGTGTSAEAEALDLLAFAADGDARGALAALEIAASMAGPDRRITRALAAEALPRRYARYDKTGEGHYNLVSALHKAVRGSDPDAALYWLARMIDGGEDPLYIARRLIRMATEDIGLGDPRALSVTVAAKDAYHFLGSPEGDLALAEAVVYLATAPKSNRVYAAFGKAMRLARDTPAAPVPFHIRNAPTELMKELGYGAGYRYDHDEPDAYAAQDFLPEAVRGQSIYEPTRRGFESEIAKRLEYWMAKRRAAKQEDG